jgi:hypothetical protein
VVPATAIDAEELPRGWCHWRRASFGAQTAGAAAEAARNCLLSMDPQAEMHLPEALPWLPKSDIIGRTIVPRNCEVG